MKVAIQGVSGSFHDAATQYYFVNQPLTLVNCETFTEVFASITKDIAEYGVVAVENSLYGSIHETYDRIVEHHLPIIGEVILPINQQLIGFSDVPLSTITTVFSHPAALDQCRIFLETHLPHAELVEYFDTAAAVEHIKALGDPSSAAIASETAAKINDMAIVAANIQDSTDNITRFVVIAKSPIRNPEANKASIILTTSHKPGALYDALGVFKKYDCNLTKLESRPIRGQQFKYQFIVDVTSDETALISAISDLERQNCQVTLLGHYKTD